VTDVFEELYLTLTSGSGATLITSLSDSGIERRLTKGDPGTLVGPALTREGWGLTLSEPFCPRPRLIVFGGGHVTMALAPMAAMMDFELIIYDDRPSFSSPARFPMADRAICDSFESIGANLAFTERDYVVIVTRGHRHDEDCLKTVLDGPEPFYTGMVGSRRRVAIVKKRLAAEGRDPGRLERLDSPIGLAIGAITPAELAISILGGIVQKRRENQRRPGHVVLEAFADMDLLRFLSGPRPEDLALVTVVTSSGSTPRRAGAKMAVHFDGRIVGSIGGGCSEAAVITKARAIASSGGYELAAVDLTDSAEEDGMVCGGSMEVLIERLPASTAP
jgi:xanthine dehydrogenase accessory factor